MRLNFTNKAGMFLVAAGISFGLSAGNMGQQGDFEGQQHLQQQDFAGDQFQENYEQKCAPKKECVLMFHKKRERKLGARKCETRIHRHQIQYRVATTCSDQVDKTRAEKCVSEKDHPYVKPDACDQQAQLDAQLANLVMSECSQDQNQQQQGGPLERSGKAKTDTITEKRQIHNGETKTTEYFDALERTRTNVKEWMEEETWNSYESHEDPADAESDWVDVSCEQAQKSVKGHRKSKK